MTINHLISTFFYISQVRWDILPDPRLFKAVSNKPYYGCKVTYGEYPDGLMFLEISKEPLVVSGSQLKEKPSDLLIKEMLEDLEGKSNTYDAETLAPVLTILEELTSIAKKR